MKLKIKTIQKWTAGYLYVWHIADWGRGKTAESKGVEYWDDDALSIVADAIDPERGGAAVERINGRLYSERVEVASETYNYATDAEIDAAGWADDIRGIEKWGVAQWQRPSRLAAGIYNSRN